MSYLLGYQKWRKLHESAKYRKIYEQQTTSPTEITFAMYSRTDTAPFRDWMLRDYKRWTNVPTNIITNSKNVAMWEIGLRDALLGNWSNAVRGAELADSISTRDTFECEGVKLAGDKPSGKIMYAPEKDVKVKASGNGLLALTRLHEVLKLRSDELKKPIEELIKGNGAIIIEFNYAAPTADQSAKAGKEEKSRYAKYFGFENNSFLKEEETFNSFNMMAGVYFTHLYYLASISETETEENKLTTSKKLDGLIASESIWKNAKGPLDSFLALRTKVPSLPQETFDEARVKKEYNSIIQKIKKASPSLSEVSIIDNWLSAMVKIQPMEAFAKLTLASPQTPFEKTLSIFSVGSVLPDFFTYCMARGARIYMKSEFSSSGFTQKYHDELINGFIESIKKSISNILTETQKAGTKYNKQFISTGAAIVGHWRGGVDLPAGELKSTKPVTAGEDKGFQSGR